VQRVFVKVIGFDDAERHAINTLFRVSQGSEITYALWSPDYGVEADIALIDSDSHEALVEFASPRNAHLKMAWIGPGAPAQAWRSFERPVQWPDVVAAMDALLQPPPDFDLTNPGGLEEAAVAAEAAGKRALIASPDPAERLYIRARLALANLTQADEAGNASDLLELVGRHRYDVAVVDFALPGAPVWELLRQLRSGAQPIPHLIVTKDKITAADRLRSWREGTEHLMAKPPHPAQLKELLGRV
jgi:CheY-like chemotaxis protein